MIHDKNSENYDEQLSRFGETLRELEVPEGLRESNKKRIRTALDSLHTNSKRPTAWYRRGFRVPYPVAAGFLLVFCLQAVFSAAYLTGQFAGNVKSNGGVTQNGSIGRSEDNVTPYYSEQGVYVAGMGFIEKSKTYYRMENSYEDN